jgi:hypothetical protein
MGIFSNAFKRELGKNSAKWLSNKILGDKWSTPQKVIIKHEPENELNKQNSEQKKTGVWDFMIELVKK